MLLGQAKRQGDVLSISMNYTGLLAGISAQLLAADANRKRFVISTQGTASCFFGSLDPCSTANGLMVLDSSPIRWFKVEDWGSFVTGALFGICSMNCDVVIYAASALAN